MQKEIEEKGEFTAGEDHKLIRKQTRLDTNVSSFVDFQSSLDVIADESSLSIEEHGITDDIAFPPTMKYQPSARILRYMITKVFESKKDKHGVMTDFLF